MHKNEEMDSAEDIRRNLYENRSLIVKKMEIAYILPYLPLLELKKFKELVSTANISTEEANRQLCDYIVKHPCKAVLKGFLYTLRQAGMTAIYNKVRGAEVKDERIFVELIFRNMDVFQKIDSMKVLSYYFQKRIIQDLHKMELENYIRNNRKQGFVMMISFFSTMENWFFVFAKSLRELKENEALQAISPLLIISNAKSDGSLLDQIQEIANSYEDALPEEIRSSLSERAVDNEHFLNYVRLFGSIIFKVDMYQVALCLLQSGIMRHDELMTLHKPSSSYTIAVINFLIKVLVKRDGDYYFIKALQDSKETEALNCLDFKIGDDEGTIKSKLKQLGVVDVTANLDSIELEKQRNKEGRETDKNSNCSSDDLQFDADLMNLHSSGRRQNFDLRSECSSGRNDLPVQSVCRSDTSDVGADSGYNLMDDDELLAYNRKKLEMKQKKITEEKVVVPHKLKIKKLEAWSTSGQSIKQAVLERLEPLMDQIRDGPSGKDVVTNSDGSTVVSFRDEQVAKFALEIFGDSLEMSPVEEDVYKHPTKGNILYQSNAPGREAKFELREYQKELAEFAITGQNCIVIAPTGSGKTHVAIFIIRSHLERETNGKIVFIVPTVALVEQQKKQIEKFSEGVSAKVCGLSGASDLSLQQLIDKFNVFVMTPQILNNVSDQAILQKVTLLIFDECHHTNKDHPYNSIMSRYLQIRHDSRNVPLPQIVGLTASIGVGKSKNTDEAIKYIEGICANLDCAQICTVIRNTKELDSFVNKPDEKMNELHGRMKDPFNDAINKVMEVIEKKMLESPEKINAEKEIKNFGKDIKPPSVRGSDPYTQWLSRVRKAVCTIFRQDTRLFFVTCVDYLMVYNNSLMINADCRTKDAVNYIENKVKADCSSSLSLTAGFNEFLSEQWRDKQGYLRRIADDDEYRNPKLEHIKRMIIECFKEDPDSRCILFCKTREMTTALVNWMNETPELMDLNPTKLVGTNAPANKEGMTSVQQDDVLKYFKGGEHKIIIATSVAEEGLDVQKCNKVIRYEHVTNSISRVQTRGRARRENAEYVLVAEKGRGAAEREEKNAIRENMMEIAVKYFQNLGFQERKTRIFQLQRANLISRKFAESGSLASQNMRKLRTEEEFEIRCLKCDQFAALSTDVRKIEQSHHVITCPMIRDRIEIKPHPESAVLSLNFEKTGKIYCAKCKSDWGIMALYKNVPFPVIKISSFVVKNGYSQNTYKQWKNVPFIVPSLDVEDLQKAAKVDIFTGMREDPWNRLDLNDFDFYDNDTGSYNPCL